MTFPNTEAAELARAKRILATGEITPDAPSTPSKKPTFAEITDAVEAVTTPLAEDIDELIAAARARLALAPAPAAKDDRLEAPDPQVVNELLAKAAELKRVEDTAKADRAKITNLLAEITGNAAELAVNKAVVFTVTRVESRGLNTDFIKSKHPDIPGNEDYYKTTISVRRNYK